MKRIQFETSLGIVCGTITTETKEYDDFGERFIVDIDAVCEDNLDHYSWRSIFIYNFEYVKIELENTSYGYPEYKYRKLKEDVQESGIEKEMLELFWEECGCINVVKEYSNEN